MNHRQHCSAVGVEEFEEYSASDMQFPKAGNEQNSREYQIFIISRILCLDRPATSHQLFPTIPNFSLVHLKSIVCCAPNNFLLYQPGIEASMGLTPAFTSPIILPVSHFHSCIFSGPTEINVQHQELNLHTVTRLTTNRARRRLTSSIETNALPLRQTTNNCVRS